MINLKIMAVCAVVIAALAYCATYAGMQYMLYLRCLLVAGFIFIVALIREFIAAIKELL